ncbi:MAG: ATP-binding protein [Pseudomonadota bacterium]
MIIVTICAIYQAMYIPRILDLSDALKKKSIFLFGPRQTGKSSLIRHALPKTKVFNLLDQSTFLKLSTSPAFLRETLTPKDKIVVIDEIQKLPMLLDEVQLLIEEKGIHFLLTGSSSRALKRRGVNLLGGRARSRFLHPFIFNELKDFNLIQALNRGLIPSIYFSDSPQEDLKAYCGDYLQNEILAEGLTRNLPAFSRFLEVAAMSQGKLINFTEIANDSQVKLSTVREYFQILQDTLIAVEVPAFLKTRKRKAIQTSKFYFFDVGVAASLACRGSITGKSPLFGEAFETYLFHELCAFKDYTKKECLQYWRSASGFEVDFILDEHTAIEVKGKSIITEKDLRGLKALREEKLMKKYFLVSLEKEIRKVDGIEIYPWDQFLQMLWS